MASVWRGLKPFILPGFFGKPDKTYFRKKKIKKILDGYKYSRQKKES